MDSPCGCLYFQTKKSVPALLAIINLEIVGSLAHSLDPLPALVSIVALQFVEKRGLTMFLLSNSHPEQIMSKVKECPAGVRRPLEKQGTHGTFSGTVPAHG